MAVFTDVHANDPDRAFIESLIFLGDFGPQKTSFDPEGKVTWSTLHRWQSALGLPASPGLLDKDRRDYLLTRAECAQHLWRALSLSEEWFPDSIPAADLADMLPFDQEDDNVPDRLQPPR